MFLGGTAHFHAMLGLLLLLSAATNGVAGEPMQGASSGDVRVSEVDVSRRAAGRWDAIIAGDFRSAFGFLSPGMRRVVPFKYYQSKVKAAVTDWVEARVESAVCEIDVCALAIRVGFVYKGGLGLMKDQASSSLIREKWLFSDGEWWLVPDRI